MSDRDIELKDDEPVVQNVAQFIIEYCRESVKKDFAKFSAVLAVIFSMGLWAIKSIWYAYMSGKFFVYKIDRCYINANSENIFLQIIQFGAILIIWFTTNYIYYRISIAEDKSKLHWKKIRNVLFFWLVEMLLFVVIILFASPIGFRKEVGGTTGREIVSLVAMLFILCLLTNIYAIEFLIECSYKRKKGTNKQKVELRTKDEMKRELRAMILTVIVTFSAEMIVVFGIAIWTEYEKNDYKLIMTQCERNVENDYIIEYEENEYEIYPIAYENEDCYIVTRLYNQNGKIKIDYAYQKIIPKEGQETIYFDNIYNMRLSN